MKTKIKLTVITLLMGLSTICAQELALVRENDLFGYIDKSGAFVIAPQFEKADSFSNGLAPVLQDDKWGFINTSGEWAIQPGYDRVKAFNSGIAVVLQDDKWGYINTKGEVMETPVTEKIYDFQDGLAFLRKEGMVGLLGTDGKVVLEPSYEEIKPFVDGHAKVKKDGLWGMIDKKGELVIPVEYQELGTYNKNGVWARKGDAFGVLIGNELKVVDGADKIWDFSEGSTLTYARSDKQVGFINNQGAWVIQAQYRAARAFNKGLAPVRGKKKKWGYIDEKGNVVVDYIYKDAEVFSNDGLAPVKEKDWGFINTSGELVIPTDYAISVGLSFSFSDYVQQKGFIDGVARVKSDNGWGFLDKNGEPLGGKWYQNAELFSE